MCNFRLEKRTLIENPKVGERSAKASDMAAYRAPASAKPVEAPIKAQAQKVQVDVDKLSEADLVGFWKRRNPPPTLQQLDAMSARRRPQTAMSVWGQGM